MFKKVVLTRYTNKLVTLSRIIKQFIAINNSQEKIFLRIMPEIVILLLILLLLSLQKVPSLITATLKMEASFKV